MFIRLLLIAIAFGLIAAITSSEMNDDDRNNANEQKQSAATDNDNYNHNTHSNIIPKSLKELQQRISIYKLLKSIHDSHSYWIEPPNNIEHQLKRNEVLIQEWWSEIMKHVAIVEEDERRLLRDQRTRLRGGG